MAIIKRLSQVLMDRRHQSYVAHSYEDLMRQRVFQIAFGYEDANDCNVLRHDPAFKMLPVSRQVTRGEGHVTRHRHLSDMMHTAAYN